MGILDDSNPYRGLRADDATDEQRLRSAHRVAVVSLLMALLWGFGFFSFGGMLGGATTSAYLKRHDEGRVYRRIAQAAVVLGSLGVIATLAFVGSKFFGESGSGFE